MSAADLEHRGGPKASVGETNKETKQKEDEVYLGGNEEPKESGREAVEDERCGEAKFRRAWDNVVASSPDYLTLGREYGSERAHYDERAPGQVGRKSSVLW